MKNPRLIQRCTIRRPLNDFRGERFSRAVSLDYMGAAEFEFNATSKSLRAIEAAGGISVMSLVDDARFTHEDNHLRVAFPADATEEFKEKYVEFLSELRNGSVAAERKLKEPSYFNKASRSVASSRKHTDLWWDIRNHVMWSFDKAFMKRLEGHIKESLVVMNMAKKSI